MAIVINGSGTVTGLAVGGLPDGTVDAGTLATDSVVTGKIADGAILNADINSSAAIVGSKINGSFGKVLQFKSAIFRGQVTTMSSNWVAMPDNLSITPVSATSKLYVMATSGGIFHRNAQFGYQIFRDTNQTSATSNDFQLFVHNSDSSNQTATHKLSCVVTSGNTNATNFKVYGKGSGDYTRWDDNGTDERLFTIMEIEA